MRPQNDETTELLALSNEAGEGGQPLQRRVDRYARRRHGRRAAVLSAIAPLLVMSAVAAMAATSTGPFDPGSSGRVVTASVVAPRQQEASPSPSETAPNAEPSAQAPAQPVTVAPPPPAVPEPYLVASGDTMATLEQHCGMPWRRVFDANADIADPDELHAGMVVRCPAPDEQLAERPLTAPTPDPPPAESDEEPAPESEPEPAPEPPSGAGVWDDLAECESGGNWSINTGNGYYGGLQFSISSWRAVGGSGYPHENSKAEQIHRGELLQDAQGWGAWPSCARKLGLI